MSLELREVNKNQSKLSSNKIVKIQLSNKNDIRISWNFNGLLMPKIFRRHVFVCAEQKQSSIAQTFDIMKNCYEFFKNGDLYTFSLANSKSLNWNEKSKIDRYYLADFIGKKPSGKSKNVREGICDLLSNLSKYRQPTFVFISYDSSIQTHEIQTIISQHKQSKKLSCLFILFSPQIQENIIQFSKGICYLNSLNNKMNDVSHFYKYYDDHLACIQAEILLQSLSGDVFMKKEIWKPIQFSIFSRKIHYPLANYLNDSIETYKLCSGKLKCWNFKIHVKYKLLNGDIFSASREISVPLVPDIQKHVTCDKNEKRKKFQLYWGIQLAENPFEKQSFLQLGI